MDKKIWTSEALLLAVTPLIGYILAFRFESGYAEAVGIPEYLITISLTQVINVTLNILFSFFSLLVIWNFFYMFFPIDKLPGSIRQSISTVLPSILLCSVYLFIFGAKSKEWIWLLPVVFFFIILVFILPLFTQSKEKGYAEKLEKQMKEEAKVSSLFGKIHSYIGREGYYLFFVLLFFIIFASALGRSAALNQKYIYYYENNPNKILLRSYGDILISANYDPETKHIKNELFIQKISDTTSLCLIKKKIEGLKLEEIN